MSVFVLCFAALAEPSEYSGRVFRSRLVLSSTTAFHDCRFQGCRAETIEDYAGGALFLSKSPISLVVTDCAFDECYALDAGGAIFADTVLSMSIARASCVECNATLESFLAAVVNSSTTGSLELVESSVTGCSVIYNTMYLRFRDCWAGTRTNVDSLNLTKNEALQRASGLLVIGHFNLSLRFCLVKGNRRAGVLLFSKNITWSDIGCLTLWGNLYNAPSSEPGMIFVDSSFVLRYCIFDGNLGGSFVAGTGSVAFVGCVFDVHSVAETDGVEISFASCAFATHTHSVPSCVMRTVPRRRTATRWPTRTMSPTKRATRLRSKTPTRTLPRSMTRCATPTLSMTPCATPTRSPLIFAGQDIGERWLVNRSTSFRDCSFRGLKSDEVGGAIYHAGNDWTLSVDGCLFVSCSAPVGGAVYVRPSQSVSVTRSSGALCTAENAGSFVYLYISWTMNGTIALATTSATACSGSYHTIVIACDKNEGGSTSRAEGVNSTDNKATAAGAGLDVSRHYNLSFCFCTFARNGPANCLLLGYVPTSDVSCLAFLGNVYTSGVTPGMICVNHASLVLVACIFQGNTAVQFLGQSAGTNCTIEFVRCVFDVEEVTVNGSLTFTMTDCLHVVEPTSLTECRVTRIPVGTRTRIILEAAEPWEPGKAVVAWVAAAGLACVVLVAVIARRLMKRETTTVE
jgi:hypothetical protein